MRRPNRSRIAVVCLLAAAVVAAAPARADEGNTLLIVVDGSGSMWGQIDGQNKIVIARQVLGEVVDGLPADTRVGMIAYGHRKEGDCQDIETLFPIGPLDREALKEAVDTLNPKGKTPITASLQRAFEALAESDGAATVILISDGLETCGGDPCEAVRAVRESGADLLLHVVGFDVAGEDVSQLECAAQAGGGLFFSAENAPELSAALEQAVAMPAEVPAGRLSVKVVADGALQDASILVSTAGTGEDAGGGRTYSDEGTNPRLIPLADGTYDVLVRAVGIKGDVTRRWTIEISDGATVEKVVDYSTGELTIGVTRNNELEDASFRVRVPSTGEQAASGRTYERQETNPKTVRLTAGTYQVEVKSVKISGDPTEDLGLVEVPPAGSAEVSFNYRTGTLKVGAVRGSELVDATVRISSVASGTSVGQGRTYTNEKSNPKTFLLPAGEYQVEIREIRGEQRQLTVTVVEGEEALHMVDMAGGG